MKQLPISIYTLSVVSFVWAGVSLGGNLVAAPAKFQVTDLTLSLALQVGRAQFTWLGYVEWLFLGSIIILWLISRIPMTALFLIPASIYLIQRLWVMPILNERSDLIIAQSVVPEGNLHIIFITFEITKFITLIVFGLLMIISNVKG